MRQDGEYITTPRWTVVQVPVINGFTTARLQAKQTLTNVASTIDQNADFIIENTGDTSVTIQLQETADYTPTGSRANVGSSQAIVPGGRKTFTAFLTKPYLEVNCTSGEGLIKLSINSMIRWIELGFNKLDTTYPQLRLVQSRMGVPEIPSITAATTNEDTQSTTGLVITRNITSGLEVTQFLIKNIVGGTLYKNDGTTAITNGTFITFAEGNAGLKFTPSSNSLANGTFDVQAATGSTGIAGLLSAPASGIVTITPVADTPSITAATTNENTQSTTGLVITRNGADGAEVTHFKITAITGGALYKNDGTTAITNGTFITFAEGNAGLKFTPTAASVAAGAFNIQASVSNVDGGLGGGVVGATITVVPTASTPSITAASTTGTTQTSSGLVITRNANNGAEVTHFKITAITGGNLFKNDGTTAITNGTFITFAEGNAGLKFTPTSSPETGHFSIQASVSNVDGGLGGGVITANITVT